jgi:hypothetical protein
MGGSGGTDVWLGLSRSRAALATRCYASTNRRTRQATYPAVCGKRATLLGNVDRAAVRAELTKPPQVK